MREALASVPRIGTRAGRLLAVWFLLCGGGEAGASEVQGLRMYRSPDSTRLVFDLSSAADFRVETLPASGDKPERLLIELKNTALAASAESLALQETPIAQIRFGRHNDFDLWTVLDLKASVTPKVFLLNPTGQYGDRLVVDLYDVPVTTVQSTVVASPAPPPSTAPSDARLPAAAPTRPPAPALPLRDILIVVDAGHGGDDPGATGPGRLREKDITLKIAKELVEVINRQPGYRAELTRKGDYFIPLQGRSKIAADKKADLFVSIHADAFTNKQASGASVFAWSQRGATSTTAKYLADSENLSDLAGGADPSAVDNTLALVLADLSIDGVVTYSLGMGSDILQEIGRITKLHKHHVEQAGFMVLKSVRVPSLLIETGFISNPDEARKLNSADYQAQLSRAIFNGINRYFTRVPPPNTRLAAQHSGQGGMVSTSTVETSSPPRPAPDPVPARPTVHVVKRGDTLSEIASRYGVTVSALKRHNRLKSSVIYVGQKIKIPS